MRIRNWFLSGVLILIFALTAALGISMLVEGVTLWGIGYLALSAGFAILAETVLFGGRK